MRQLLFDRLAEDGTHLVLIDSRGVQYSLAVQESLATNIRRGLQRTSSKSAPGTITPREIQSLVRKGLSIEEVADQTGLAVDFVQRFAEPVLAEMDFVIQRARRLSIHAAGHKIGVDELVDVAAQRADVPTQELQWSCRKTEGATWRIDAGTGDRDLVGLLFKVSEGTITPADAGTADLLRAATGRVVDLPETTVLSPAMPQHWDAQHPAAKAAARSGQAIMQPVGPDDPSRIF
jgi:hypothetical protein